MTRKPRKTSGQGRPRQSVPRVPQADPQAERAARRRRALVNGMFWIACLSIVALAIAEVLGFASAGLRLALMIGVGVAGTVAIVLQAPRKCPDCGASYGYFPRILKPNVCRYCGGTFPSWPSDS